MTREAIEYFKFNRRIFCEDYLKICPKDSIAYQVTLKEKEFYDMAIKALEQEPILDKIRAEIERLQKMCNADDLNLMAQYSAFGMVLDILDKYKAETEAEDDK